MAGADLTTPALATLLLDLVETFDLRAVTWVGSDIGVAICRCAVAGSDRRARRIAGLLLTNGDAFDEHAARRLVGEAAPDKATFDAIVSRLSTGEGRRAFFERQVWTPLSDVEIYDLLDGFMESADVRRDALRALAGTRHWPSSDRETFDGPVKILWGKEDDCLPVELGARLAAIYTNGELRALPEARLLVPLDQPESVAEAILDILESRKPAA